MIWDFQTLTLVAFYFHPSLDVARAQWKVSEGESVTASARPNPTLSVAPGYTANAASAVSPWLAAVNFDVPIETAGKRGYRKAKAKQLSESARLNIVTTAWQVRKNLRDSLLDFADAQERQSLLTKQNEVQRELVRRFQEQLQAGAISAADISLARIAFTKSQSDLSAAQTRLVEMRVRIAENLGMPASSLANENFGLDFPTQINLNASEARRRALQSRTDILAALADYAATQSELQLQVAKQFPDVHIGPGYQYDQGGNKWSLGLTVELPLLNRNQGGIAEAKARREESAAKLLALQAKISAEIDRASAAYQAAQEQLTSGRLLLELQTRQQKFVEDQLKAGEIDRLQVLTAQMEFQSAKILQLDAQTRARKALADFEDAVQQPFDSQPAMLVEQNPRAEENKP